MKPHRGPPMTLGVAAAAGVRLIAWCKECRHQVEPDPAEMATRYGAETSVLDWRERLVVFPVRQPAGRHGAERNVSATQMAVSGPDPGCVETRKLSEDGVSEANFFASPSL